MRWRDLLRDGAFVRLLSFAAVVQLCVLSTGTFITIFVREEVHIQDGFILWISAGAALVGIFGLRLLRSRIDGMGSRPFLGVVFLWWTFYYLAWFLLAAHLVGGALFLAPLLMLAAGFFASIYELSLTRLWTVSYTHLDGYKRQARRSGCRHRRIKSSRGGAQIFGVCVALAKE